MNTRFYFSWKGGTDVMPGLAAWDRISEGLRRKMSPTKDSSPLTIAHKIWALGTYPANQTALCRQFVSDPMAAGISFATTDTIKCYVRVVEANANSNINRQPICVKVVSQDGLTLRSTLKALGHYGPNTTEWPTAAFTSKTFADGDTLDANYTTVTGDRLVVEVGGQLSGAGGSQVGGNFYLGNSSVTDLAENETDTTSSNPWFEITSTTITFLPPPAPPPVVPCASPLVDTPPSPDYKETLCDVTTLAELMSYSQDDGSGNAWIYPVETAGKRMVNAAGLMLVNDTSAANHVNYIRLLSAPNPGENGYGLQNIQILFPADKYPEFCCRFITRRWIGGICFVGEVAFLTNSAQGLVFWRDDLSGEVRLVSYMFTETSGDFISPLTGPTFFNDIIQIEQHWRLLSHAPVSGSPGKERYQTAVDVLIKVNGVQVSSRHLEGEVTSDRYNQDPSKGLVPWQLLFQNVTYSEDELFEVHGWEFACVGGQFGGVMEYRHVMANGTIRTTVGLGGQPKGGYRRYRPLFGQTHKAYPTLPIDRPLEPPVEGGLVLQSLTESVTIAAAAFTDTTIQFPVGAIAQTVDVRVTTAIPTAATFNVGDSALATRYATGVSTALDSTDPGNDAFGFVYSAATSVRITPNLTPATNVGRVRVTINYLIVT